MPRDGSGNFTLPANTQAVSGDPISSTKFNTLVQDLEADANTDRPVVAGGTGASTASGARANLGIEIGVNVQAYDAGLLSIAGLTTVADRSIYTTASDTYAVYTLTAAGRAILDDADAAAQRTTLGLGTAATVNTGTSGATIPLLNGTNIFGSSQTILGQLNLDSNGFARVAYLDGGAAVWSVGLRVDNDANYYIWRESGAGSVVVTGSGFTFNSNTVWHAGNDGAGSGLDADTLDGTQPTAFALTILDDVDAAAVRATIGVGLGTGDLVAANNLSDVSNVGTARTNLGLVIGTDVQAYNQYLADIAAISPSQGDILYFNGTDYVRLAAGSSGQFLRTQGAGANPNWQTISATGDLLAANNLSDLTNAATARTNLGLAIGTNVQAYDAGLLSIAGLTTTADRGIYTTASDTYAVFTLTSAGRAILDDADATAQRTTLGLGTAATVNTGTSGGTVPLLNAANTFSARQTIGTLSGSDATHQGDVQIFSQPTGAASPGGLEFKTSTFGSGFGWRITGIDAGGGTPLLFYTREGSATWTEVMRLTAANVLTVNSNTVWHAGNDGAGSGLDADTLDGVQGSDYVTLTGTQTLTNKTLTTPTINGGTSSTRVIASSETTGTLTVASANKTIQATGDITIPNAVFSAGDIILIYAGASSRTITEGSSVTMRLGGSSTTGSRTLAARGVAVLFFVSSSEVVVSGGAVT